MYSRKRLGWVGVWGMVLTCSMARAADMGTAFTYQGSLENPPGTPYTGTCDFRFGLWDDIAAGALVPVEVPIYVNPTTSGAVPVSGGIFTATVDFGPGAINGTARWLEIEVACGGLACVGGPLNGSPCITNADCPGGSCLPALPALLSPRVELTPAPHALALPGVATRQDTQQVLITAPGGVGIGTNEPKAALDVNGRVIVRGREPQPTTGTGMEIGYNPTTEIGFIQVVDRDAATSKNLFLGQGYVGIGATTPAARLHIGGTPGVDGIMFPDGTLQTSALGGGGGGAWSLTGNGGTNPTTNFLGTTDNVALELRVNGQRALRLEPKPNAPNIIGGYSGNSVSPGMVGATIGGGGTSGLINSVTSNFGTVGGGEANTASGGESTIGGGGYNEAGASDSTIGGGRGNRITDAYGTIAGGLSNRAGDNAGTTTDSMYATVGGGYFNQAMGISSTIGGGNGNTARGEYSTIGGGYDNTASSIYCTVGGGESNTASGNQSTVGGGSNNTASSFYSTVGGGDSNTASGSTSTIGGGSSNYAGSLCAGGSNDGLRCYYDPDCPDGVCPFVYLNTIGGGYLNNASAPRSTVGGGALNTASGEDSTVPGGVYNSAGGNYSFAAGQRAQANHAGTFVWSDSTTVAPGFFTSTGNNQFLINASGGVGIGTNNPLVTLHVEGDAIFLDDYGSTSNDAPEFFGRRARGTSAAPTAVTTDDVLVMVGGSGYDGTVFAPKALIDMRAAETFTASARGTYMRFVTTGLGSSIATERMRIDPGGNVGIGTNAPGSMLNVAGAVAIGSAYSDSSAPTDGLIVQGHVGIADSTPDAVLDVSGSSETVAMFNRSGTAGSVIEIQDDGVTVGTISFDAAGLVTYGTFTGSHLAWTDEPIEYSALVSLTGSNRRWHDLAHAEIVYGITPSAVPNNPRCLGAYLGLLEPTQPFDADNPHQVASVGNGDMWVVDTGRNIEPGQYLMSSDVKGHAMLDDESRFPVGYVIARAGEPVDWSKVNESVDGHKHKKISVFFESFERGSAVAVGKSVAAQQEEIDALKSRVATLERALTANAPSARPVSLASIGGFAIPALALLGFVGLIVRGRVHNGGGR